MSATLFTLGTNDCFVVKRQAQLIRQMFLVEQKPVTRLLSFS
ncbi:hypothetical protein C4J97_3391 [Pseudomonas orientalis]|nr:hypothetical protein C4J97_3391 [Pseudomonas orientalis]